jgi:hypothetical protein
MSDWIGYRWLIDHLDLNLVQPLRLETQIGATRATASDGTTERRTVQESLRPEPTITAHLGFALKHEGVHLEALSRLFARAPAIEIESWVRHEPSGQYARRAAFFYERLTGKRLDLADTPRGNYVSAIESERELTASNSTNNTRWRVRDNLLGGPGFSPQVYLNADTTRAINFDVHTRITSLESQFSEDLVLRSAVWLTIKESRASFAIEHEEDKRDRIQRFAAVMGQRTGQSTDPLSDATLDALQREILGPNALHYGQRQSPVFVGESGRSGDEHVHYIAPGADDLPNLMSGLREVLQRTSGSSSVARAALISFGFVYLHPMVDGNGRISRFLINDVLRRDGALPAPHILPISAILQRANLRPLSYDGALEVFSGPFMRRYQSHWSFGPSQHGSDGVKYNLQFDRYEDALHAWRYPDLSRHVSFIADALDLTIEQEMRGEAQYLQRHGAARTRLKNIVEGPDPALDHIIRSVRQSRGIISGKLKAEHPILQRLEIEQDVVRAIYEEFPWSTGGDA